MRTSFAYDKRLHHSPSGYLRLLQIANASFQLLVEGPRDVFFYHRLCLAAFGNSITFEVRAAHELPVPTGGKPGLLQYYDALRCSQHLCSTFEGKVTAIVFALDKDVDDLLRIQRRSLHVIYTELFEMENYLYSFGPVSDALAAAARTSPPNVQRALPPNWTTVAPETWREWIALCVINQIVNTNFVRANKGQKYYSAKSRLNNPCTAPTAAGSYSSGLTAIQRSANLDSETMARIVSRTQRMIEARFKSESHGTVFRGKWYSVFLRNWIKVVSSHGWSPDELESALLLGLNFTDDWAQRLRGRFNRVVDTCGIPRYAL